MSDPWREQYLYEFARQYRREQETHSTIDIHHVQIESSQRIYQMIDTPGNPKYIKHMIKGVVQADAAILVVDDDCFEDLLSADSQIQEKLLVAQSLGLKQLVVAYNFNSNQKDLASGRLENCKEGFCPYLKKLGFNPANVLYVLT